MIELVEVMPVKQKVRIKCDLVIHVDYLEMFTTMLSKFDEDKLLHLLNIDSIDELRSKIEVWNA